MHSVTKTKVLNALKPNKELTFYILLNKYFVANHYISVKNWKYFFFIKKSIIFKEKSKHYFNQILKAFIWRYAQQDIPRGRESTNNLHPLLTSKLYLCITIYTVIISHLSLSATGLCTQCLSSYSIRDAYKKSISLLSLHKSRH
jgi:hypothetical protein